MAGGRLRFDTEGPMSGKLRGPSSPFVGVREESDLKLDRPLVWRSRLATRGGVAFMSPGDGRATPTRDGHPLLPRRVRLPPPLAPRARRAPRRRATTSRGSRWR